MADKTPSKMIYNYLGCSGIKVSNICLGAMTFGIPVNSPDKPGQMKEEGSHAMLDRFVELGGNFIDTANVYSMGRSEQIVGTWLNKQTREGIVLATKVRGTMVGDDPNGRGLSRKHISSNIEASLKRLQTDYVDLYQIHGWDNGTPIEEILRTLDDLVRCGKVRYVGASNVTGWQLQKIVERSRQMGLNKWITLQQQYNLLCRQSELEPFEVCKNEGMGVLPWSPLKGGLLSGKHKRNTVPAADTRIGWSYNTGEVRQSHPEWRNYTDDDRYWNLIAVMSEIGKQYDKTIAQVAIRWLLQKDIVSSVIIGVTKIEQLESNVSAGSGWQLTRQQMTALDLAAAYEIPYPYETIRGMNAGRLRPGDEH